MEKLDKSFLFLLFFSFFVYAFILFEIASNLSGDIKLIMLGMSILFFISSFYSTLKFFKNQENKFWSILAIIHLSIIYILALVFLFYRYILPILKSQI